MATPARVETITLPPPTGGVNFVDPLASMPETDSPWMVNVDCESSSVNVRSGYAFFCNLSSVSPSVGRGLGVHGVAANEKLFIYTYNVGGNTIYDGSSGTPSLVHVAGAALNEVAFTVNWNSRLAFLMRTDWANVNRVYDGTSWSAWGFTYGGSPIGGLVATGFKTRLYIFNGASMYYSVVNGVTGATSLVDLSTVFEEKAAVAWAAPLSSPGDRPEELYLAIGNQAGEVLVYAGDYPVDPNWRLIGRFKTAPPCGWNAIIKAQNDIIIITTAGHVSLRGLFAGGTLGTQDLTISRNIDPKFRNVVLSGGSGALWGFDIANRFSGVFWPEKNKLVTLARAQYESVDTLNNQNSLFFYNFETRAWCIHNVTIQSADHLVVFGGRIHFLISSGVVGYNVPGVGYRDENVLSAGTFNSYSWAIWGAYNDFGSTIANKRIVAFEPIIRTGFTTGDETSFGMKAVSDFGKKVSAQASGTVLAGYNSPYYSVGAEGTYLSYRLEGTIDAASADIGLELYAVGAIIQPGGIR